MANRHLVIVQDHQHIGALMTGMRQRFKGHTTGDGAVAYDGDDLAINALVLGGQCHPHRSRNAGRGVANTEGVIGALGTLWEPGQALKLSHAVHAIAPASQNLVRIGLVPDVPDNAIVRRVEHVVKCHGQFHHAQPRTEVATGACDRIQQVMPQLFGESNQVLSVEPVQCPQIGRDSIQQRRFRAGCRQFLDHAEDHTPSAGLSDALNLCVIRRDQTVF